MRKFVELLGRKKYTIVTHFPVKEFVDTYAMNLSNGDVSIYFEYANRPVTDSTRRINHLIEKEKVAIKKDNNPLILSKEEKEGIAEPMIVEVYQKGFLYNGKLLRPALTKVAIPLVTDHSGDEKE